MKLLVANTNGFDCLLGNNFNCATRITVDCQNFTVHGPRSVGRWSSKSKTRSTKALTDHNYSATNCVTGDFTALHQAEDLGLVYLDLDCDDSNVEKVFTKSPESWVANLNPLPSKEDQKPPVEEGVMEAIEELEIPGIREKEKTEMKDLLKEFKANFSISNRKLGCSKIWMHEIKTGVSSSVSRAPYRYSAADQEEIRKQID